jgi:nitroreductase
MNTSSSLHSIPKLLQERYGQDYNSAEFSLPDSDSLNTILDNLLNHRSVRAFLDQPLADGTIELLLAAAQSASTSSNLQAWSVVLVQDPTRKDTLATLAGNQNHIREAPLFMVWLADLSRFQRLSEQHQFPIEALPYLETFLVGCIDAALAAQNATLAAEAMGLGAVYIGGIRNQIDQVAQVLDLPPLVFPVFGLVIGHPDPARPSAIKPRLPQRAIAFHERYTPPIEQEHQDIAAYDALLQRFQAEQHLPQGDWSQQVLKRLRGIKALQGREQLREKLHTMGFELR